MMNDEPKNVVCLLLMNDGKIKKIATRYRCEGEAINVATLLNKLASPVNGGRYSVVSIDEDDKDQLKKYKYFDYDFNDSWDDECIEFTEEEEGDPK